MVAVFVASQQFSVNHFPANEYAVQNKCRMRDFNLSTIVPMNFVAGYRLRLSRQDSLGRVEPHNLGDTPILCGIYAPVVQHLTEADVKMMENWPWLLIGTWRNVTREKVFGFDYG